MASWGDDGRLTQWASTQHPHGASDALCQLYGLAPEQVRVIAPDVGGGFGAKVGLYPEELLLAWLARGGRPARPLDRDPFGEHARPGAWPRPDPDDHDRRQPRRARSLAYRLEVVQDAGAYPAIGAVLPVPDRHDGSRHLRHPQGGVQRGRRGHQHHPDRRLPRGRPARGDRSHRAGHGPLRRRDRHGPGRGAPAEPDRPGRFPYTTVTGATYDVGDYERALDLALEAAGYEELRAEQARRRAEGGPRQLGIGVSTYVEITNGAGDTSEFAAVEVLPSGRARVHTGSSPHGQGHVTAWSMIASEQLGIPMEDIEVVANDTDLVAKGGGTFGSRSLQAGGVAVHEASISLVDQARKLAADLLEASPDDVVLDKVGSRFHVAGTPAVAQSWGEVAADAGVQGRPRRSSTAPAPRPRPFRSGPTSRSSRSTPRPAR